MPDAPIEVLLLSSVSGVHLENVESWLSSAGLRTEIVALLDHDAWRQIMAGGGVRRALTRLAATCAFPFLALWQSIHAKPDVIIVVTNPYFLPSVVLATRRLHGAKVIPLIYDLFPDVLTHQRRGRRYDIVDAVFGRANEILFRRSDGVVFIGDRIARHAQDRYGRVAHPTTIAAGGDFPDLEAHHECAAEDLLAWVGDRTLVSYVGNLGTAHDWQTMVEGVLHLDPEEHAFVCAAIGSGSRQLQRLRSVEHVKLVPPLSGSRWATLLRRTDIFVVTQRARHRTSCTPSKLFGALAAECAILAVAPRDSDLSDIVTETACGVVVQAGDAAGFAEAIGMMSRREALSKYKRAALHAMQTRYGPATLRVKWSTYVASIARRDEA